MCFLVLCRVTCGGVVAFLLRNGCFVEECGFVELWWLFCWGMVAFCGMVAYRCCGDLWWCGGWVVWRLSVCVVACFNSVDFHYYYYNAATTNRIYEIVFLALFIHFMSSFIHFMTPNIIPSKKVVRNCWQIHLNHILQMNQISHIFLKWTFCLEKLIC